MHVQAYLFFDGRCEEAMRFYERALGARLLTLIRRRDVPGATPEDLARGHHVSHASLRLGDSVLMAADDAAAPPMAHRGFALSLGAKDEGDAKRLFVALADGGVVRAPLAPTSWSPAYGSVTDRFGVSWRVSAPALDGG